MKINTSTAKKYATALFDVCASSGNQEQAYKEIISINEVCEDAQLKKLFYNDYIPNSYTATLLDALQLFGLSQYVESLVRILLIKKTFSLFPAICAEYKKLLLQHKNAVEVIITTAQETQAEQTKQLKEILTKHLGKSIELEFKVDPNILGGMIASVKNLVYDFSIKTSLHRLKNQ